MGQLDSAIPSLPKQSGTTGTADQAINYTVAPAGKLVNESFEAVSNTFGSVGPFTKLNEGAPTFDELSAAATFKKLERTDPYYTAGSSIANIENSQVSASETNRAVGNSSTSDNTDHMVKLTADAAYSEVVGPNAFIEQQVIFTIMPEVSEARNAEYEALSPSQLPGEFQKYKGTKSTTWAINGMFTCRTREEARINYIFLNTLRGWTMPYFGEKQIGLFPGKLGSPPPVLKFSGWRGLVGTVPVVLTQLQWNWPKDCDWIPTGITDSNGQEIPFPTVMNVTINLIESFSPEQFNGFNLLAFKQGRMVDAWSRQERIQQDVSVAEPIGGRQGITGINEAQTSIDIPNNTDITQIQNTTNNKVKPNSPTQIIDLKKKISIDQQDLDNNNNSLIFQRDALAKATGNATFTEADRIKAQKNIDSTVALIEKLADRINQNETLLISLGA